jgi:hypothetical protein
VKSSEILSIYPSCELGTVQAHWHVLQGKLREMGEGVQISLTS